MPDRSNTDFSRARYTEYITQNVENKAVRDALFELGEFAVNNAFKVKHGKGQGTFQYIVKTWDSTAMLYSWDIETVYLRLGNFPWVKPNTRSHFVRSLTKLSNGFNYLKRLIEEGKSVEHFEIKQTLSDPIIMKAFQKAVLEFQNKLYNTRP